MLYEAITDDDNQKIHSANDLTTVSGFSWSHSLEFAKVRTYLCKVSDSLLIRVTN